MFAPAVAKARTNAATPSVKSLPARSTLMGRPFGGAAERAQMLQRGIGNQAVLRLLRRDAGRTGNEPRSNGGQPAGAASQPRQSPALPRNLQTKLVIGEVDDPLEREADSVADRVLGMPADSPAISPAAPQVSRACAACENEELHRSAASPAAIGGDSAPASVHRVLGEPGRPLDRGARAFFEPRFGTDLGHIRLHDDVGAGRSAHAVGAHAYTVGNHIAFAGRVDIASDGGRRLLAHELTHTIQQASGGAQSVPPRLQRQVLGATELEAMKDPECPPEAPYRWGPKRGPGGADPAVVAPCLPTPMPRPRQNLLDPGTVPDQPSAPPSPAPAPVREPSRTQADQQPPASPTAPASPVGSEAKDKPAEEDQGSGYDFEDDPLSAGGFGPGDATIRVRPGPVRTTLLRPRAANLACSYEMRQIAAFGGSAGSMNLAQLAKDITAAFTGCEIAYVSIDVVPKADDDPSQHAMERAESIKQQLMQAIGPGKFAEDRFYTGLSSGGPGEPEVSIWLGGRNQPGYGSVGDRGTAAGKELPPRKPPGEESEQVSAQAGLGDVQHYYTSPHGANDPLHEWLSQFVAAYTIQHHAKNKSGEESQIFAQVQYSLSTRQFTLSFGGQESYVIALRPDLQLSFWAQLMAGENVSSRTQQKSLTAGTQIVWQPKDWLGIGAQAGIGPTVQSSGPSSIDRGALIFFQIQK